MASKVNFFIRSESAMQRAILQSSVQIPILPDLASSTLLLICFLMSRKSFSIRFLLSLTKGINSVEAPKASQIPNPKKQPIALDS